MQLQLLVLSVLSMRLVARAQVETVTLFDVAGPTDPTIPPDFNQISVSVLGVNSQGATTYVEEGAASREIIAKDSTTQTITISTPLSFTMTFVDDASKDVETVVPLLSGGLSYGRTCTWGSDGNGACVEGYYYPAESTEYVATWTGTKRPITTLIVSLPTTAATSTTTPAAAATTTSPNHGSTLQLGGGAHLVKAMLVIAILQVVGGLMVLL